jgi:hypothetical protein
VRVISSCLVSVLLLGLAATPAAADASPVRLDVGLTADADPSAVLTALGGSVVTSKVVPGLTAITVDVPAAEAGAVLKVLTGTPGVRYAEPGALVQADRDSRPGFYGGNAIRLTEAWTWTSGSPDVTVAVVDTGVSPTSDITADRLVPGHDFVDGDSDAADGDGHGTAMASVLGADHDTSGASGACGQCRIMPVRVLQDRGAAPADGTTADVAAGIVWAADHGARIINLSLSTETRSGLLEDAIRHAAAKGALVVASAGNVTSTARRYPAAFESVLAVGRADHPTQNSADDRWVDVEASGDMADIVPFNGPWGIVRGTSVTTAAVAGVAALGIAMTTDVTATELRTRLVGAATTGSSPRPPRIDAAEFLHDMGGTDSEPPVVTRTGLTAGELIASSGRYVTPVVTDDHGIKRIDYLIGGTVVATVPRSGTNTVENVPPGYRGDVPVTMRAHDYGGNITEVVVVVRADTVGPVATIVSPVPGEVVPRRFEVIVETPDDDAVQVWASSMSADFHFTRIGGTNRWRGTVESPHDGAFNVELRDASGLRSVLIPTVRIDDQPPAGGTVAPRSGVTLRGPFVSSVGALVDAGGVASAALWANDVYVGTDSTAPFALTVRPGSFSGNVRLVWRVTDRFGHGRSLAPHTVVADNKAPTVTITKAPKNKARVKGTTRVYVKASDYSGIARVELIVNGRVVARDAKAGYVLAVNASKQKKTMKVQVRAYDKLGNVKYTTTRTWYRK